MIESGNILPVLLQRSPSCDVWAWRWHCNCRSNYQYWW